MPDNFRIKKRGRGLFCSSIGNVARDLRICVCERDREIYFVYEKCRKREFCVCVREIEGVIFLCEPPPLGGESEREREKDVIACV